MRSRNRATDVALIAVFAAFIAACTLVPAIPVGIGVPITLQTFAVALTGIVLGPRRGFLSVLLYLVVGLAGLPVFAQGGSGLGALTRPSAGYLISFPLAAAVSGVLAASYLSRTRKAAAFGLSLSALAGTVFVVHPLGVIGLMINARLPLFQAAAADVIYLPGDLVKAVLAGVVAAVIHRAFPGLMATSARSTPVRVP